MTVSEQKLKESKEKKYGEGPTPDLIFFRLKFAKKK